eukprot:TRINITY_DN7065_c0_g1_i3.p1 TRINITY_DN7065_c0_g1~~TRINITY_DN7065_c0_g1_i3.p1  ORF type:complete len:900 (-),score=310.49 TRINITY_DN7065_c0_g1_i3:51-2750(-)
MSWSQFEQLWPLLVNFKARAEKAKVEGLSKVDLADAKEVFEMIDTDNSGFVDGQELGVLCKWLHAEIEPALSNEQILIETEKMVGMLDTNHDGKVSYSEFETYCLQQMGQLSTLTRCLKQQRAGVAIDHSEVPAALKRKLDTICRSLCTQTVESLVTAVPRLRSITKAHFDSLLAKSDRKTLEPSHMESMATCVVNVLAGEHASAEDKAADTQIYLEQVLKDNVEPVLPNGVTWELLDKTVSLLILARFEFEKHKLRSAAKVPMSEARQIFDRLDADHSEYLTGAELAELASWAFQQVSVDGEPCTQEEIARDTARLIKDMDADGDARISFEEFEAFFNNKAMLTDLEARARAQRVQAAAPNMASPPVPEKLEGALSAARKLFTQLDVDRSHELQGQELKQLVSAFLGLVTPEGTPQSGVDADTKMIMNLVGDDSITFEAFEQLYNRVMLRNMEYAQHMSAEAVVVDKAEIRLMFDKLDKDGSKFLEGEEIAELGRWLFQKFCPGGMGLSADQVEVETSKMLLEIDSDGDKKVSFDEFVRYLEKMGNQYKTLLEVHTKYDLPVLSNITLSIAQQKFNALDKDKSGLLDLAEAKVFATWIYTSFQTKGDALSEAQAETEACKLMNKLDLNNDGNIIFEEFEAFFCQRAAQSARVAKTRRKKGHEHTDCLNEDMAPAFSPVDCSSGRVTHSDGPEMSRAYRKFMELDVDKSGTLSTDEMLALADFLYTSFNTKGEVLDHGQRQIEAEKLVRKLDKDGDGEISFEEFAKFIEDRLEKLEKFNAKRKAKRDAAAAEEEEGPAMPVLNVYDAHEMFKKLDKDNSGGLNLVEMKELAHWVYSSFSSTGDRLDNNQIEIEAGKLVRKLDKNDNSGISFDEFVEFFELKAKQAKKFAAAKAKKAARK